MSSQSKKGRKKPIQEEPDIPESKKGRPKGQSTSECQCVSFLTPSGLERNLRSLQQAGKIGHWWFVSHTPETIQSEKDKKPHQHVRMCPPLSGTVNWTDVTDSVQETILGEDLPRRLVVSREDINNNRLDGLLYARHNTRYLTIKGELRQYLDYPFEDFVTDDPEWLKALWIESDTFEPKPKRLSKSDILDKLEKCSGRMSQKVLLRLCVLNNIGRSDYLMLMEYRAILLQDLKDFSQERAEQQSNEHQDHHPEQPFLPTSNEHSNSFDDGPDGPVGNSSPVSRPS